MEPMKSGVQTRRFSWCTSKPCFMASNVLMLNQRVPADWMTQAHQSMLRGEREQPAATAPGPVLAGPVDGLHELRVPRGGEEEGADEERDPDHRGGDEEA